MAVDPEYLGKGLTKRLVYKVSGAANKGSMKVEVMCSLACKIIVE